jgi:hypothetical protein
LRTFAEERMKWGMRTAFASCVTMLLAACSLSQPQLGQNARAPAGWEGFCFPATIAFLPGTARVSPGTERMIPVIYDMHLRHSEWMYLGVEGGPNANDYAARRLASSRAQAALRLLRRLGARPDRVEVHIFYRGDVARLHGDVDANLPSSSDATIPMDWAANVVTMIPPEQVKRNRALQREDPPSVLC